jgi:phage-related protein (TIGR01555 family)
MDFLKQILRRWLGIEAPRAEEPEKPEKPKGMQIKAGLLTPTPAQIKPMDRYELPEPAPGVVPAGHQVMAFDAKEKANKAMAFDDALSSITSPNFNWAVNSALSEGLTFLGYPYLAELTQRPEYRKPAEIIAKEMTRKWIKLQASGDDDKTEKIKAIESEWKRLNVQHVFRKAAEHDCFFGRGQIYIDTGAGDNPEELMTPLSVSVAKIGKGSLKGIRIVEPMWTYPNLYNSNDPLKEDFFKPSSWFIMGKQVHSSRLMMLVSREVPDLLKPVYAFGGLSLTQALKPYVDNWLRTRQSVSDLVHSFTTHVLKTNMSSILNAGAGKAENDRAMLFTQMRDNLGLFEIDKDTEDFDNISVPLGGLDHLQAQAQEQMASIAGIPLIILLKITPSGLNASSEGEISSFNDWIEAMQEALFTPHLSRLLDITQLSLFGEIDTEIGFKYEPLGKRDELVAANARKTDADTDAVLIGAGVISPDESRTRIAAEEGSPYAGLALNEEIEPIGEPEEEDGHPGAESDNA